jgi:ComF family protein
MVDALLAVLLAPTCVICAQTLERPSEGTVCAACWSSILPLALPVCESCGDPLATWRAVAGAPARCARCRRLRRRITKARAAGAYEGGLRTLIHALKYEGRRTLAQPLAALMRARGADVLAGADYVVAVPLHPSRCRQRGFNQADDLARHLELPLVVGLHRVRATRVQADLPAARRHANVRDAFAITPQSLILRDRIVVLVDDVSTTGATLDACAEALLGSGVREVRALTAARVVAKRR